MSSFSLSIISIINHILLHYTVSTHLLRTARDSDDDDEDDRKVSRGCTLQYQRAQVKVMTQFHTTSTEGTNQMITMLGPDWQVDVTELVQDSLKVVDARVAELVDRTVLVANEFGSSTLKVEHLHNGPYTCKCKTGDLKEEWVKIY